DRGARVHLHRRRRTAQVAQQILEALEIGRGDLEDVTVLTRDVVTLQDAGMFFHLAHPWLVADVVGFGVAHRDERGDRESGFGAIDPRAVPGDVACLFESLHPLHHRRSRQSNLIGQGLVTRSPVDRKSTRLNSSHLVISYAVFCLKKKKKKKKKTKTQNKQI